MSSLQAHRKIYREPTQNARGKLAILARQTTRDATDPAVVALASRIAKPYRPDDWRGIAGEIFRFVRDGIRYQHDPDKQEEFADAVTILSRGWDDCDGKAKLTVALMRALGLDAEIVPHWSAGQLAHVSIRVRFPGSSRLPGNVRGWLYGETTVRGSDLGDNPRRIAPNQDTGRFPLSGGPSAENGVPCRSCPSK
jgi:transglutaminase-like putative cysteine protease